jgi:hypothetical protein
MTEERKVVLPGLSLTISTDAGASTLEVRGRLDADTAGVLAGELDRLAGDVTLDLGELDGFTDEAVACIADHGARLASAGGSLVIMRGIGGPAAELVERLPPA